jgi:hypothetical protein
MEREKQSNNKIKKSQIQQQSTFKRKKSAERFAPGG